MRKSILILILLILITYFLHGVDETTKKRFSKTEIYREKQVEIVKFEALKPDIERYQKKSEIDLSKGYYQLDKSNIRKTNKVLLNKWLKEFK